MRQEMLLYYIDGKVYNREHDRQFLESLARMGYLEWSYTDRYECYFKTTVNGLLCLNVFGYDVPAPEVRDGCIVGKDERIRLVDWDPSVLKASDAATQDRGMSYSRFVDRWFRRRMS